MTDTSDEHTRHALLRRALAVHALRGGLGVLGVIAYLALTTSHPWLALAALGGALVSWRGCPTCWISGMLALLRARARGEAPESLCIDGRCGLPPRAKEAPDRIG
jgi:hypothetical protein